MVFTGFSELKTTILIIKINKNRPIINDIRLEQNLEFFFSIGQKKQEYEIINTNAILNKCCFFNHNECSEIFLADVPN